VCEACSMHGIEENCIHNYNILVGKHGRNEDRLEDNRLDGMHRNRMDDAEVGCGRACSELIWFVTETRRISVRYCEH
jgi:hypothetical protein